MRKPIAAAIVFVIFAVACGGTPAVPSAAPTVPAPAATPTTATVAPAAVTTTAAAATTTTVVRPDQLPTAREIMADGLVTDHERELARIAVFECVIAAGADTTYELFDLDPVVRRDYRRELTDCQLNYPGLYRYEIFPRDRFNLGLLGVVECVEDRTGKFFGAKTVHEIGWLTEVSHDTIDAAVTEELDTYKECHRSVLGEDADGGGTEIVGLALDHGDEKRLMIEVADCGYNVAGILVEETAAAVKVEAFSSGTAGANCWIRHPVRLKDPLGTRSVIDASTGQAVAFTAP